MKKLISLTLAMTLIIGLIGCASATPSQGTATEDAVDTATSVESTASGETAASDEAKETASSDQAAKGSADGRFHSAEYPLYAATVDLGMPIKLYFRDGAEDLPYIDTDTVMQLLNLLIATGSREFKYSSEAKGADYIITRENTMENTVDNGVYADLDFEKNIITFSDYDLFLWKPGTTTILDLINASTFNKDGEPQTLQKVDKTTLDRYGVEFVLPLRDYNIELERQDDLYLIPMQTFVDFFLSPPYNTNLFFNGQVVIAQQSINGNELYYAAPTGERSAALAEFGYNELCMLLDYRYGLKEVHGINKFDSLY